MIELVAGWVFCLTAMNALAWRRVGGARPAQGARQSLAVLVPARNEERNVPGLLESILAQGDVVTEIMFYDDGSSDATPLVIAKLAEREPRVRLVPSRPLPQGWCGKNFACWNLASAAQSDWLLFLDADARLAAGAVDRMLAEAESRKATLLSAWPSIEMQSVGERLLMPLLNFVVFTLYPAPLALICNDANLGVAHGACILARRDVYHLVGGHRAVAGEIFEDTRIAQLWRARGQRSLCLDGQDIVRVRMYSSPFEIWRGFEKNFFPAFRNQLSFWLFLALHFSVFLLPFMLGLWVPATLVIATRLLLCARFRHPFWSALLHPVGEVVLIALGVSSWWRCVSGRGVAWKGRDYLTVTKS